MYSCSFMLKLMSSRRHGHHYIEVMVCKNSKEGICKPLVLVSYMLRFLNVQVCYGGKNSPLLCCERLEDTELSVAAVQWQQKSMSVSVFPRISVYFQRWHKKKIGGKTQNLPKSCRKVLGLLSWCIDAVQWKQTVNNLPHSWNMWVNHASFHWSDKNRSVWSTEDTVTSPRLTHQTQLPYFHQLFYIVCFCVTLIGAF